MLTFYYGSLQHNNNSCLCSSFALNTGVYTAMETVPPDRLYNPGCTRKCLEFDPLPLFRRPPSDTLFLGRFSFYTCIIFVSYEEKIEVISKRSVVNSRAQIDHPKYKLKPSGTRHQQIPRYPQRIYTGQTLPPFPSQSTFYHRLSQ